MALKKYEDNIKESLSTKPSPKKKSGVACTEPKCKGEMMLFDPVVRHPELTRLRRSSCSKCGWRGWV